ncbi:MAG: hypothetical protein M3N42_13435 [Cyanobacteriota bacterium]|nr:hypothetical protein [Cyanobacteriota bacterium]
MPPISGQSPNAGDKICIDRETFQQIFLLINRSTGTLTDARYRKVFLDCLATYLVESVALDDDQCFQASLLLDAYYEYVPACLAELFCNLQKALELMRAVNHD